MSYIIIGIHGLSNKPSPDTLQNDWRSAILEGLLKNCRITIEADELNFKSVYWAHHRYDDPISQNDEPYIEADGPLQQYKEGWLDTARIFLGDAVGDAIQWTKETFNIYKLADEVLERKLPDLNAYYQNPELNKLLKKELSDALLEERDKPRRIMLIAHSMGTIISYDVLRELGRANPGFFVDHWITIGSPLGLPHVMVKIAQSHKLLRTPSVVRKWTNFSDRLDPVALDTHLSDDYEANDYGVCVRDDLVINSYTGNSGKSNHHKSYGYLRAPEVSDEIKKFI